ncbi:MAG: pyridoxamine 5'-phosphate oxidase family protein [Thermomicrobiales bacterium]|jgi:uncharacterized pyridoxamine 5'-phosphate oxidase family protein|nr:pyridoxamine 5'-phosphate oxidase family protein [Thermomicrobiales bacterium]
MADQGPQGRLDTRFSSEGAETAHWPKVEEVLRSAEVYWLSTTDRQGAPHVTPLVAVLVSGSMYFGTGEAEQKARNIERNPHCALTTGCNQLNDGLDVVIRGAAIRVVDHETLANVAEALRAKYGWGYEVGEGALVAENSPHPALVFEVRAETVFAFSKGMPFGQTRWQLGADNA